MTRSQTAAASSNTSVAAVHAAAQPRPGGDKRRVRLVNNAWDMDNDNFVAAILLELAGQPASMHSRRYATNELAGRPRRSCASY